MRQADCDNGFDQPGFSESDLGVFLIMAMTAAEKAVFQFAKSTSKTPHAGKVICKFTRRDIIDINKMIEPKIRQNEMERTASMDAASRCIVGGK